jgi:hypothetical protein
LRGTRAKRLNAIALKNYSARSASVKQHGQTEYLPGGAILGELHFITLFKLLAFFNKNQFWLFFCMYFDHNLVLNRTSHAAKLLRTARVLTIVCLHNLKLTATLRLMWVRHQRWLLSQCLKISCYLLNVRKLTKNIVDI